MTIDLTPSADPCEIECLRFVPFGHFFDFTHAAILRISFPEMLYLDFSEFPYLHTQRLHLRPLEFTDLPALVSLRSDAVVNRYLERPPTTTEAEAIRFIEKIRESVSRHESIYWAISLKDSEALIGTICFWNIRPEKETAEIGYELKSEFHGQGLMTEAVAAAIHYGRDMLKFKTITAFPMKGNLASIKILECSDFLLDTAGRFGDEAASDNYYCYFLAF